MTETAKPADNFQALFDVARTLQSIQDADALLEKILEIAMTHLSAERACLLLRQGPDEDGYAVAAFRNFSTKETSDAFAASSSVVKKVMTTGEPVLTSDALTDRRFVASESIIAQKLLSIICIPLRSGDRVGGAVYLDSSVSRKAFTDDALKFLTVFGNLAALAIDNAKRYAGLREANQRLINEVSASRISPSIVGTSPKWKKVMELVQRVIDVDAAVLITGESGTGKELIARAVHENGNRQEKAFVAVNCSAIPEQLLESELFGYVRGAFTGAGADKKGLVEVSDGGTMFLDEIADLPLAMQSKLLRLLQEKEYRRVGDTKNRNVDIRMIAATNRNLPDEVKAGRFREDLYFRLNVVDIHLPPLRERAEDIPALARHFFKRACETHRRPVESIGPEAMAWLYRQEWKGNVREFQNAIERAVVLCRGKQLTQEDFLTGGEHASKSLRSLTLAELERQIIEGTLAEMQGNRTRTAERLGVSLRWLQYRLKEWGKE